MKKNIIIGLVILVGIIISVFSLNVIPKQNVTFVFGNVEAYAECEDSIDKSGSVITVLVCDRKTSIADALAGLSCATTATTKCSFTNYHPH